MADEEEEPVVKNPMFVLGVGGYTANAVAQAFAEAEGEEGWEVTGTLKSGTTKPKWVSSIVETSAEALGPALERARVIILDLVGDAALSERCLELLAALPPSEEEKVVLGISTVLTWARTSEADPEDPEKALTEEEYKRRRPHVNFRDVHTLEKLVVRAKREGVRAHVVCAGLQYGLEEEVLHDLFKRAWHNEALPLLCQGEGANLVPTVHVKDLCSILLHVAENEAPAYVLAVDQALAEGQTFKAITEAIAVNVGTGEVVPAPKDEAALDKSADLFNLDLRLEPTAALDFGFEWHAPRGLVKHIHTVTKEFRKARAIEPLKLIVVGALAGVSGVLEHTFCESISREYKVPHLTAASMIAEVVAEQSALADEVRAAEAADKGKTGTLPDELLVKIATKKLNSTVCTNQGWVLDGFPISLAQLKLLAPEKEDDEEEEAAADEGGDEEGEGGPPPKPPADLTPESVIVLHAADDSLKARVQGMSQPQVEATGMTQDQLTKRLQLYAQTSAPEGPHNPLMHKAVRALEPLELDTDSMGQEELMTKARLYLGKARNYGPTEAEVRAKEERQAALKAEEEAAAEKRAAARLEEEKAEREQLRAAEQARAAELEQQERELLEARSVPLRSYLMSEVIPTLTEGLIEVTKVRPDDPVDYLAEWLFKNNPVIE